MSARFFLLCVLLVSLSFSIQMTAPMERDVQDGDVIDVGTIGPGQTVSLTINPVVTSGGTYGTGGYYDLAVVEELPDGWAGEKSKFYGNVLTPLQVTITAAPGAREGIYNATVVIMDEGNGEELGNITLTVKVRITWDVMDFDVSPSYLTVGPGQPAQFDITILNKGSASDVFEVSAIGPKRWEFKRAVFVPAQSSRAIRYEVVGAEEETYKTTIKVVSLASPNIEEEKNVTLFVQSNLFGDYKATNHGTLVFPIFETLVYSLAGLISNFF